VVGCFLAHLVHSIFHQSVCYESTRSDDPRASWISLTIDGLETHFPNVSVSDPKSNVSISGKVGRSRSRSRLQLEVKRLGLVSVSDLNVSFTSVIYEAMSRNIRRQSIDVTEYGRDVKHMAPICAMEKCGFFYLQSSKSATIVTVFGDYKRKLHYFDLLWICCTDELDQRVATLVVLIASRDAIDGVGTDGVGTCEQQKPVDALVLFTSPTTLYVVPQCQ